MNQARQDHLASLFRRFPDLPKEVVFKEDLLTAGVAPVEGAPICLPAVLHLEGGPFCLRRTIVRAQERSDAPYLLEGGDGQVAIVDRISRVTLVTARPFPEIPASLSQHTEFLNVIAADGSISLDVCSSHGQPRDQHIVPSDVGMGVSDVFASAGWSPRERPLRIALSTCIPSTNPGEQLEIETLMTYVSAIKGAIENRYPLLLDTSPLPQVVEQRLQRAGVNGRLPNLSIWDSRLFASFFPDKEQSIGWEEWVRRILDQVYVYGEGAVQPTLVVGMGMLCPNGFDTVGEAVRSLREGLFFMMSHGTVPVLRHPNPTQLFSAQSNRSLPVELFLEADRAWYEEWVFHRLPEPIGHLVGPGRNRYPDSAALDVGRGARLPTSEKGKEA